MYDSYLGSDSWLPGMDSVGTSLTEHAQQAASDIQVPQDVTDEDAWKQQAVDASGNALKDLFGTVAKSLGVKKDTPVPTTSSAPLPSTPPKKLLSTDPGQFTVNQAAAGKPGMSPGAKTILMVGALAGVAFFGYKMMAKPKRRGRRRRR